MDEAEIEDGRLRRRWFVLHVKPRTEKKVFAFLEAIGAFRYLPLYKKTVRVQRRKVVRYLPIFPGYVFTRLYPDERTRVYGTGNIVQMIVVTRPRHMVHQLRQIARAGRLAPDLEPVPDFSVGDLVRVEFGPFRGMEGCVRRKDGLTRLVLMLDILGQAVEVAIDPRDLKKAENASTRP